MRTASERRGKTMADTFEFTLDEESEKKLFEIMTDFDTKTIPSFTITDKYGHTAEYVKVTRCKDCKNYDGWYCHHKGYGDGYAHYTPPIKSEEGFCDWAKERENE